MSCIEYFRSEDFWTALTCFEQYNLIILAQVHKASNAFGKLHHILNSISDVVRALLPHPLSWLQKRHKKDWSANTTSALIPSEQTFNIRSDSDVIYSKTHQFKYFYHYTVFSDLLSLHCSAVNVCDDQRLVNSVHNIPCSEKHVFPQVCIVPRWISSCLQRCTGTSPSET